MKIYFDADIEERKYEGRSQTAVKIKDFLAKNGFELVDHPSKADLIQVHSSGIGASFRAAAWKKKYVIPVIYSLYSLSKTEWLNHWRNHFAQRYYLRPRKTSFILSYSAVLPLKLRGYNLKKLDLVITPSEYVKNRLYGNSEVVRIGIDLDKFKPLPRKSPKRENETKPKEIKVGFFGHPSAYKGILDFARASKFFSEDYIGYVYISDSSERIVQNLKKINPALNIVGHTANIVQAYNEMDIIVLPYRSHLAGVANPLVLLEAMACGKAIITTDFSYLKEIVKDSAMIIKPYSPKEIVSAVEKLEEPSLREELGGKARKIAEKEYDLNLMLNKYLDICRRFEKQ